MQEVYEFLKACGTYYLATLDGSQPRVRPFGTVDLYNGKLTIQTGRSKDVSRQMLANPQVEICAFNGQRWLRVAAKAVEVPELADETSSTLLSVSQQFPLLQVSDLKTGNFQGDELPVEYYTFLYVTDRIRYSPEL